MQTSTSTQFLHNTLVSNSNRNNYNPALFNVAPHWWWFLVLPLENTNSQDLDIPREPIELSPMSPSVIAVQSCLEPGYPGSRTTWKSLFPSKMFSVWMWAVFFVEEENTFSYYYSWKASDLVHQQLSLAPMPRPWLVMAAGCLGTVWILPVDLGWKLYLAGTKYGSGRIVVISGE